jgi:hypothetical protein
MITITWLGGVRYVCERSEHRAKQGYWGKLKVDGVGYAARHRLIYFLAQDERHSYEKCQYEEFKQRVAKMEQLRAEQKAQ